MKFAVSTLLVLALGAVTEAQHQHANVRAGHHIVKGRVAPPKFGLGEDCTEDSQCESDICSYDNLTNDLTCAAPGGEGDPCYFDKDCISKDCGCDYETCEYDTCA